MSLSFISSTFLAGTDCLVATQQSQLPSPGPFPQPQNSSETYTMEGTGTMDRWLYQTKYQTQQPAAPRVDLGGSGSGMHHHHTSAASADAHMRSHSLPHYDLLLATQQKLAYQSGHHTPISPNRKASSSQTCSQDNLLSMKYHLSPPGVSYNAGGDDLLYRSPRPPCSRENLHDRGSNGTFAAAHNNAKWITAAASNHVVGVPKKKKAASKYRDFASLSQAQLEQQLPPPRTRGGVVSPFPVRLHKMLESADADGYETIVAWQPHGRAFVIHDRDAFVAEIMPKYFMQTKFPSFQRQLNLYGFQRLQSSGPDQGAYFHERCLKGMRRLSYTIPRVSVNGNAVRQCVDPELEPLLHTFPPVNGGGNTVAGGSGSNSNTDLPFKGEDSAKPEKQEQQRGRSSETSFDGGGAFMHAAALAAAAAAASQKEGPQQRRQRPSLVISSVDAAASTAMVPLLQAVQQQQQRRAQQPLPMLTTMTLQNVLELPLTELDLDLIDPNAVQLTKKGQDDQLPQIDWDV